MSGAQIWVAPPPPPGEDVWQYYFEAGLPDEDAGQGSASVPESVRAWAGDCERMLAPEGGTAACLEAGGRSLDQLIKREFVSVSTRRDLDAFRSEEIIDAMGVLALSRGLMYIESQSGIAHLPDGTIIEYTP